VKLIPKEGEATKEGENVPNVQLAFPSRILYCAAYRGVSGGVQEQPSQPEAQANDAAPTLLLPLVGRM
jgi:hypothetical protein